jgi:hypothetical protein
MLIACTIALGLSTTSALASTDPARLVLRLGDLPAGFHASRAGVVDNAAAAKAGPVSHATYERWGRLSGYDAYFDREAALSDFLKGAISVESSSNVYRSPVGAHQSFNSTRAACSKPPITRLSTGGARLGQESVLCAFTRKSNGYTFQVFAIEWRRGPVKAGLIAAGIKGGISPTEALALAEKQDQLIARNLH